MASGTKTFKAEDYYYDNSAIDLGTISAATEYTSKIQLFTSETEIPTPTGKRRWDNVLFQLVIASITTNVVIRFQGSLDGENWFNTDAEEKDTTITADGTYGFAYEGKGEINYIRLYFVSESGGTDATIAVKAKVY